MLLPIATVCSNHDNFRYHGTITEIQIITNLYFDFILGEVPFFTGSSGFLSVHHVDLSVLSYHFTMVFNDDLLIK